MRLIDADAIVFDYSGLAYISPYDFKGAAKYFADQIKAMPTITPPPNDPLTLEELREMDGEPVWVDTRTITDRKFWGIVYVNQKTNELTVQDKLYTLRSNSYRRSWLAYRQKPEEKNNG